jgi:cell pole-organizing protein PopZ
MAVPAAKPDHVEDRKMDEILASIRRMIADDEGATVAAATSPAAPARVSRLFIDAPPVPEVAEGAALPVADNVVELAIAQAMEDARVEVVAEAAVEAAVSGPIVVPAVEAQVAPMPPLAETPGAFLDTASGADATRVPPLMSPQADAAVAGAFNRLAATMLSRSARTIDELVEDLLRPLLRNWLDANLPPLVERLVREEIERVARGRR